MAITPMERIKSIAGASEVTLSGWTEDEPFVCKLRRPGLFELAARGKLPNPLLAKAGELFTGNPKRIERVEYGEQMVIMREIARAALMEPTAKQLDDIGVALTDTQYSEIYAWVLGGVTGLESFRRGVRLAAGADGQETGDAAQPTAAP